MWILVFPSVLWNGIDKTWKIWNNCKTRALIRYLSNSANYLKYWNFLNDVKKCDREVVLPYTIKAIKQTQN